MRAIWLLLSANNFYYMHKTELETVSPASSSRTALRRFGPDAQPARDVLKDSDHWQLRARLAMRQRHDQDADNRTDRSGHG
jgi:hypothetical protein